MPVSPPAAIASRRTEGNQKRRRKWRRFCGGRTRARPRASSLRVCLADIEKKSSRRISAAAWGAATPETFRPTRRKLLEEKPRRANYNLPASRSARRVRRIVLSQNDQQNQD